MEPYQSNHKQEIIELSCDASVVSRYTAYVAVDESQNKPVSGSMEAYELTAADSFFSRAAHFHSFSGSSVRFYRKSVQLSASPPSSSSCCGGTYSSPPRQAKSVSQSSRSVPSSTTSSLSASSPQK